MATEAQIIGVHQTEENSLHPNFTHSIKIEETAKGIRFHVHVYGNGGEQTGLDALKTYEDTIGLFKKNGHVIDFL